MDKTTITTYEIIHHGVAASDNFHGYGVAFTDYENCATGIGDTYNDALDDALDMLCQAEDVDCHNVSESVETIYKEECIGELENLKWSAMAELETDISNEVTPSDYADICDHAESPGDDFCEDCHGIIVEERVNHYVENGYSRYHFVSILYNLAANTQHEDTHHV